MSELDPGLQADHNPTPAPPGGARRPTLVLAGIAVAVVLCGAWAAQCLPFVLAGFSEPPLLAADASPEAVAQQYLVLRAQGRSADALIWRPERFAGATEGNGLKGITDIKVGESLEDSAVLHPEAYRALTEIRELYAQFTTTRQSPTGEPPGHNGSFVLLGKERAEGPWRVLELGTGP